MHWKDENCVGIPEMDARHRTRAGCIALVGTAATRQQRRSAVHSAFVRLADFVRIHFAVEENLMRIYRYPEFERHVREHLEFCDQVRQLQERSLRVDVSAEMVAFIKRWRQEHVMTSDKDFAAYLPSEGVVTMAPTRRATTRPTDRLAIATSGH